MKRITTEATSDFVAAADRIATFDNDGTLWPEQPTYIQFVFAFDRLKSLAHVHPELRDLEPFRTLIEGGLNVLVTLDAEVIIEILKATQSGMSTEQFSKIVAEWLAVARDPRFNRVYTRLVYQPMLELLDFLRANEFKTFIVSGMGADFIRVFAEEAYRIPPEHVIGSTMRTELRFEEAGPLLMKKPEVEVLSDGAGKPVAIDRFIGRRPIFAFGNSDGDKEMLEWAIGGSGPRLVALLHHTDAKREWAYDRHAKVGRLDEALDLAEANDWTIVNMATDWNTVFPVDAGS